MLKPHATNAGDLEKTKDIHEFLTQHKLGNNTAECPFNIKQAIQTIMMQEVRCLNRVSEGVCFWLSGHLRIPVIHPDRYLFTGCIPIPTGVQLGGV